jgi:hypothetical protein
MAPKNTATVDKILETIDAGLDAATVHAAAGELDYEGALELTQRIKSTSSELWDLLLEAHQGKAWRALGYLSWRDYVGSEFQMSRSRAYQLVDQAIVIAEIEAAAGASTSVDISEAAARDLKPHLPDVVDAVKDRIISGVEPDAAVRAVVAEVRRAKSPFTANRGVREVGPDFAKADHIASAPPVHRRGVMRGRRRLPPDEVFFNVVEQMENTARYLPDMLDINELADLPNTEEDLRRLDEALRQLKQFAARVRAARSDG